MLLLAAFSQNLPNVSQTNFETRFEYILTGNTAVDYRYSIFTRRTDQNKHYQKTNTVQRVFDSFFVVIPRGKCFQRGYQSCYKEKKQIKSHGSRRFKIKPKQIEAKYQNVFIKTSGSSLPLKAFILLCSYFIL